MFELFNARSRRVVVLAQDEAKAFGHDSIGTEHLLIALIRNGGIPANVFDQLNIAREDARDRVISSTGFGSSRDQERLAFTPALKSALEAAYRESKDLAHDYIGPEHLLLGLLAVDDGLAYQLLVDRGADSALVREIIIGLLRGNDLEEEYVEGAITSAEPVPRGVPADVRKKLSEGVTRVIAGAQRIAEQNGSLETTTVHLLAAVLLDGGGNGVPVIVSQGISTRMLLKRVQTEANNRAFGQDPIPTPPLDLHALKSISLGAREAQRLGGTSVEPEHVLLGILREKDSEAAQILAEFGTSLDLLREHVKLIQGSISQGFKVGDDEAAWVDRPVTPGMRPNKGRAVLANALTMVIALVLFTALCFALIQISRSAASWVPGMATSFSWAANWVLFLSLMLVAGGLLHWSTLKRLPGRNNMWFLAEEFLDLEWREHPQIEEVGRFDYSRQAAVVDFSSMVMRWAQRFAAGSVLTAAVCVYLLKTVGVIRETLWWGGASIVVLIVALLIWKRSFVMGSLGPFEYPSRTERLLPASIRGLHAAMSGFTGLVLAIPVLTLETHLLSRAEWWSAGAGGLLGTVFASLDSLAFLVGTSPLVAIVALCVVPLGAVILVYQLTAPLLAVDVTEWVATEDVPPALYLRTWATDRVSFRMRAVHGRFIDSVLPGRRANFTEAYARNVSRAAPLALVGEPGTMRQRGVGSMWSTDEHWKELVEAFSEYALFTVFAASEVPPESGFSWEIELVGSSCVTGRVVVVFPPGFDFNRSFGAGGYLDIASQYPIFQGIREAKPVDQTLMMARDKHGRWECYDASIADDVSYAHCLFELLLSDYASDWESGALGDTDFPSTVGVQRFAGTISVGIGVNPVTAARIVGVLYPGMRRLLVRLRSLLA